MKYSLKPILLTLIALIVISCQKDELPDSQISLSQKAKLWYEQKHNPQMDKNPAFSGQPDWDNYFQIQDELYFPLVSSKSSQSKSQKKLSPDLKKTFVKPYLVLTKNKDESYTESLKVFTSDNESNFETIDKIIKLPSLEYTYSKNTNSKRIKYYENNTEKTHRNLFAKNENNLQNKSNSCVTWYIVKIDEFSDGSVDVQILDTYEVCDNSNGGSDGSGGNSGGNGDSGGNNRPDDNLDELTEEPPSCESFKYVQHLDNTQVCATSNIRFKVKLIDHGVTEILTITFNQPIYFTTPRFSQAQGNLTNGEGANLTADAVQATTNYLVGLHLATGSSESQIRALFMQTLNEQMREGVVLGGSASLTPPLGVTPGMVPITTYKTTWLGSDNCK